MSYWKHLLLYNKQSLSFNHFYQAIWLQSSQVRSFHHMWTCQRNKWQCRNMICISMYVIRISLKWENIVESRYFSCLSIRNHHYSILTKHAVFILTCENKMEWWIIWSWQRQIFHSFNPALLSDGQPTQDWWLRWGLVGSPMCRKTTTKLVPNWP